MELFFGGNDGYVLAVNCATLAAALYLPWQELTGKGLSYSKFAQEKKEAFEVPSKLSMFMAYAPPALLAAAFLSWKFTAAVSPWNFADAFLSKFTEFPPLQKAFGFPAQEVSLRLVLFGSVVFVHFLKRVIEVLFVHKYSGNVGLLSSMAIALFYTLNTANLLYVQQLSEKLVPPARNLQWLGVLVFLIGISGNFYHHLLLARLRSDKTEKPAGSKYVVPHGGLFELVACPHYLFEIIDFLGIAMVSQTVASFCFFLTVLTYLTSRSLSTREWYLKKVDGFPESRKALVPYLL